MLRVAGVLGRSLDVGTLRSCQGQRAQMPSPIFRRLFAAAAKDAPAESSRCDLILPCLAGSWWAGACLEVKELAQMGAIAAPDESADISSLGAMRVIRHS